jgi:hypothetical protein
MRLAAQETDCVGPAATKAGFVVSLMTAAIEPS